MKRKAKKPFDAIKTWLKPKYHDMLYKEVLKASRDMIQDEYAICSSFVFWESWMINFFGRSFQISFLQIQRRCWIKQSIAINNIIKEQLSAVKETKTFHMMSYFVWVMLSGKVRPDVEGLKEKIVNSTYQEWLAYLLWYKGKKQECNIPKLRYSIAVPN